MQISTRLMLGAALLAAVGCGGGSGNDAGTDVQTGTQDSATDTGTGSDTGTGTDSGTPTDAGGDSAAATTINGCADSDFVTTPTTITFTTPTYTPKCLSVAVGTAVTFSGSFSFHPLMPGVAPSATGSAPGSSGSPITATSTGTTATFTFPTAGDYPYFCTVHQGVGMYGTIRVH